jgi:hypothetical protein
MFTLLMKQQQKFNERLGVNQGLEFLHEGTFVTSLHHYIK